MSGEAVFTLDLPSVRPAAIVADSPHSGRAYPADFGHACERIALRRSEDTRIDEVLSFLPDLGIAFLKASVARSYIDLNRADGVTPLHQNDPEGAYDLADFGLIRARATRRGFEEVYDRPLSLREAFARVQGVWQPYHDALDALMRETAARHGHAILLDFHSMPSAFSGRTENPCDIIIGTRSGNTVDPAIADRLAEAFAGTGWRVERDMRGYRGGEIVRRHGAPDEGRHAMQIEINRRLYMNEETLELSQGRAELVWKMKAAISGFAAHFG